MPIKVLMCFEVDLPTTVEQSFLDGFKPSQWGFKDIHLTSARQIGEKLPSAIPWLSREGYYFEDLPLVIIRTPDEQKEVAEPMAESGPV